jgi:hypothetical protein
MGTLSESTLIEFILYNNWANQKLLKACQNLSEDQLDVTIQGRTARSGTPRAILCEARPNTSRYSPAAVRSHVSIGTLAQVFLK